MPKTMIPPFVTFEQPEFTIEANPDLIEETSKSWEHYSTTLEDVAARMRGINLSEFQGSEGEYHAEQINNVRPAMLDNVALVYKTAAGIIYGYYETLSNILFEMFQVREAARDNHRLLEDAIKAYNKAEKDAAIAKAEAIHAANMAAIMALSPTGPLWASIAHTKAETARVAEQIRVDADLHHASMQANWEDSRTAAKNVKEELGRDVDVAVSQLKKIEKADPSKEGFVDKIRGIYYKLPADARAYHREGGKFGLVLSDLLITPPLIRQSPFPNLLESALRSPFDLEDLESKPWLDTLLLGVPRAVLTSKAFLRGEATHTETALAIGEAAAHLPTRGGAMPAKLLLRSKLKNHALDTHTLDDQRGGLITADAEPVDMSTGSWVDATTDVCIEGVLPLEVTRNCHSLFTFGRAFGTQWVSNLDCCVEVHNDQVLMLAPDGAVVRFPVPPEHGGEVRADARPWTLAFVDGAYRVRDQGAGCVYVFAVQAPLESIRPTMGGVPDQHQPSRQAARGVCAGVPRSSVAAVLGCGITWQISAVLHRSGHTIEYHYGADGLLEYMRRSDGTILDFTWDMIVRRVESIAVREENSSQDSLKLLSYAYDPWGQLRRVINTADGELAYHYDQDNRLCGWTDRNKVSFYNRFDEHGRVVAQVGSGGVHANAFVWLEDTGSDAPEQGRLCVLLKTVAPLDQVCEQGDYQRIMDRLDRLCALPVVRVLKESGLVGAGLTGCGRDGARSIQAGVVPEGLLYDDVLGEIRPTVYRSTNAGDVWRMVTPTGRCVDRQYNTYHRVIRRVDVDGGVTTWAYDEQGRITEKGFPDGSVEHRSYGAWSTPVRIGHRDGRVSTAEVDTAGNIVAFTHPQRGTIRCDYTWLSSGLVLAGVTDPAGLRVHYECDAAGRVLARETSDGRRWSVVRDVAGRIVESVDPAGAVTRVDYSPEGWPWLITHPDDTTRRFAYDGEGNIRCVVDEQGARTDYTYTVFDTLASITTADGEKTTFGVNTQLEPISVTNAQGLRWEFVRGSDGELIQQRDYNGIVTRFHSDVVQRLEHTIDALGNTTTLQFDHAGRIISETSHDDATHWEYDPLGNVKSISNNAAVLEYHYDDHGGFVGYDTRLASGERSAVIQAFDYEHNQGATAFILPTGQCVTQRIHRGVGGAVTRIEVLVDGESAADIHIQVPRQRGERSVQLNNVLRTISTNSRGWLTRDAFWVANDAGEYEAVAGCGVAWDHAGRIRSVNDIARGLSRFDYTAGGKLLAVTRAEGAPRQMTDERYEYTADGRLTTTHIGQFRDDSLEARAAKPRRQPVYAEHAMMRGTLPMQVGPTTYAYDALGRVTESVTHRSNNQPLVKQLSYRGSTGQVAEFRCSDHPNKKWVYGYDGQGRRVVKTCVDAATGEVVQRTVFMHVGDQLVAETTLVPGEATRSTVWIVDPDTAEVFGQVELIDAANISKAESFRFLAVFADVAGAPQEIIDSISGDVLGRAVHSAYGRRVWEGAVRSPLLFCGQYVDDESGLAYNRNRFYDPRTGFYTAQDPAGVTANVQSAQRYVSNPLTMVDPLGLNGCAALQRVEDYDDLTQAQKDSIPEVKEVLDGFAGDAIDQWNNKEINYSTGQLDHIREVYNKDPNQRWARYMHRGTVLDKAVKDMVKNDQDTNDDTVLGNLVTTPQGVKGPDFILKDDPEGNKMNMWYDLTTPGSAQTHLRKYGPMYDFGAKEHIVPYAHDQWQGETRTAQNLDFRGTVKRVTIE